MRDEGHERHHPALTRAFYPPIEVRAPLARVLVTLLTIGEISYLVVLGMWIVLEKRSPVATLAWILALAALPFAGLAVFFFFGPQRLKRRRLKRQRARLRVRSSHDTQVSPSRGTLELVDPRTHQLMELATAACDMPPERCGTVTILKGGKECFAALEQAIAEAKHHVHLGYYIFAPGRLGGRIRDLLIERARAGVSVRLLVDAVGSYALGRRFVKPLRDAGAEFATFNPVSFARFHPNINFRNHRKIVVCDGRVGFTGGVNVADEYIEVQGGGPPWRDVHVRLEGSAVRWLQLVFLEDWFFATDRAPHGKDYFPLVPDGEANVVQIVASGPDVDNQAIQKVYFASIAGAERRVLVATPYFVPDEAVLAALVTAALRGVDVRLLVPQKSDSRIVTAAARSYFDDLLRAGVRVFEYTPAMFHAKTLVVDDVFACIGSANMDNRSFRLNFEVAAMLYGKSHADELAAIFEIDLEGARELRAGARAQLALPARFIEAGARLLSPLL